MVLSLSPAPFALSSSKGTPFSYAQWKEGAAFDKLRLNGCGAKE